MRRLLSAASFLDSMLVDSMLLGSILLGSSLTASAQKVSQPPAGAAWSHVEAVPIGTSLHIYAHTRKSLCYLKAIDDDSLTCTRDTGVGTKDLLFQRSEIRTVKLTRRGRSAVLGGAIGAGAGALGGGLYGIHSNYFAVRGAFAMIFAFTGAFAGAPTGYLTDFTASTIYRAP